MSKKSCLDCGGDLKIKGTGYECKFCGKNFTEDDFIEKIPAASVEAGAGDGTDLYDKNINGVCEIMTEAGSGSGFLVDNEDGIIITNTHVVTNKYLPCKKIVIKIAGENVGAKILSLADDRGGNGNGVDLAMLKLDRVPVNAVSLTLEDFDNVKTGERVFVLGNSLGDGTCMTSGIVSDRLRSLGKHKFIMTDCPINGGNSGGPIFNAKGNVIGAMACSRVHPDGSATEGMNYAVPVNIIKEYLNGEHIAVELNKR